MAIEKEKYSKLYKQNANLSSEETEKIDAKQRKRKRSQNEVLLHRSKKPKLLTSEKKESGINPSRQKTKTAAVTEKVENEKKGLKPKILTGSKKSKNKQKIIKPKKLELFEMKKKDRKKLRQQHKNKVYELGMKAKHIWENLRRDDCAPKRRLQLLKELSNLVKGHVKELIFAHDTVRVIECLVTFGSSEERTLVFEELKDSVLPVAKSKYAKFFLIKMLKHGSKKQKDFILKCFHGHVLQTVRHVEAAAVLEFAYNEHANATQRAELVQEFYGPSFAVFKDGAKNLTEVFEKESSKKKSILSYMKESLLTIVQKSVIRRSIVHYVLREYMTHADLGLQAEVIEAIREVAVEILHTKDGSRVAMNCIWNGTAKDRKVIIKSLKTHVTKISKEEFGHMVLLAVFDSADDTVLVQKIIIRELTASLLELALDRHGRKVLLYLVCPRDPHFFHQDVVNILKQGDNSITRKKACSVRQKELKEAIISPLLKLIKDHASELIADNSTCLLMTALFIHAAGNTTEAVESVANLLCEPYSSAKEGKLHPVEHQAFTFMLKKLLLDDRNKPQKKEFFAESLLKSIPEGVLSTWCNCNRGAFIVLSFLETGIEPVMTRVKRELKGFHKLLAKKPYKGAQLLLQKLKIR